MTPPISKSSAQVRANKHGRPEGQKETKAPTSQIPAPADVLVFGLKKHETHTMRLPTDVRDCLNAPQSLLRSSWKSAMVASLVVQQGILGASNFYLMRLADSIRIGSGWESNFILVAACVGLSYFPTIGAMYALERWKSDFVRKFANIQTTVLFNNPQHWPNKVSHKKQVTALASEVLVLSEKLMPVMHQLWGLGISIFVHAATLSILLDPLISLGFVTSAAVSYSALMLRGRRQMFLSAKESQARKEFTGVATRNWENLMPGNAKDGAAWWNKLDDTRAKWSAARVVNVTFLESAAAGINLLAFAPTLSVIYFCLHRHAQDAAFLGATAISLPRVIVVLNYMYGFIGLSSRSKDASAQLSHLTEGLAQVGVPSGHVYRKKIQVERLGHKLNLNDFEQDFAASPAGRWTFRGENGSGKSSYLLDMKKNLGDPAWYFTQKVESEYLSPREVLAARTEPVEATDDYSADLAVPKGMPEKGRHSPGEVGFAKLTKCLASESTKVWLLDEWDNDLDLSHREQANAQIDAAAERGRVVEILHAKSKGD